jgi:hypothetical protein
MKVIHNKIAFLLGLMLVLFASSASAEEFVIEADGYHTVSRKETIMEAEDAAVNDALRWAVEQVGVRISAYSEVVNKVLKEDTVQRFASSVVKIREKTITPRVMNDDYRIYAHVVCTVNTDDLDKWEPPDVERQRRLENDLRAERERNEKLNNDLKTYKDFAEELGGTKWINREEGPKFRKIMANYRSKKDYRGMKDYCLNVISEGISGEVSVWIALGEAEIKLGEYDTAKESYEKALALCKGKNDGTIWEHIGDVYAIKGDYESASQAYSKAEFCPDKKAALAWNKGEYDEFANQLSTSHSTWHNYVYVNWLTRGTNQPKHNHKINIRKYIVDDGGASIPSESYGW